MSHFLKSCYRFDNSANALLIIRSFSFHGYILNAYFSIKRVFSSNYFFSQLFSSKDGKFVGSAELSEFFLNFFINTFQKKPKLHAILIYLLYRSLETLLLFVLMSSTETICCFVAKPF